MLAGLCWLTICKGYLSGFPFGALGELRNTSGFCLFLFSGVFVFFFYLSFIALFMRESGVFFLGH
jgi:hypothetical protein